MTSFRSMHTLTEISNAILAGALEHQLQCVAAVLSLQRDHVIVAGALENLAHVGCIESQTNVSITAEVVEPVRPEAHSDEGNVGVVNGLD